MFIIRRFVHLRTDSLPQVSHFYIGADNDPDFIENQASSMITGIYIYTHTNLSALQSIFIIYAYFGFKRI
ncbi:hypothetical protein VCRA2121O157_130102 [Vibrio crassostreae]|uniref:Uncharacterized protein n=1 Tax=Vibrio crassostreae TaxID=246167 RepID=A0A822MRV6_9VIBR|nr:hypothetical protein [Vibrio crassostreae]CAK1715862.1 hypothetical protein VCRA2112E186_110089 [Vibrio crassostreae]CAK1716912.1 hypothetical protein VCRA2119O245_110091 [Vibrio crassostreae]CAK1718843.1 hypothetical protein VCRA2113O351_110087 [Vibrio crassostreae]CAK1721103.1 hypothetical protein VCRA2118O239_110102 [Vibrio crassostreae]